MKRGRKKTPSSLNLLKGNPGKRPINHQEPVAPPGVPVWPEEIKDEVAQKRWFSLVSELQAMHLLATVDRDAIVMYCINYSRMVRALAKISGDKKNDEVMTVNSQPQQNPYLKVARDAELQMLKIGAEFGLTPSSRASLKTEPPKKEDDFEGFLAGRIG